jgi:predicted RNA-binding Zn-ribbon protein involved in translation (DUF1610 family)
MKFCYEQCRCDGCGVQYKAEELVSSAIVLSNGETYVSVVCPNCSHVIRVLKEKA